MTITFHNECEFVNKTEENEVWTSNVQECNVGVWDYVFDGRFWYMVVCNMRMNWMNIL